MAQRYLKSKQHGDVFVWHELTARNEDLVEVTEEEAFPERFMPVAAVERKSKLSGKLATSKAAVEKATTGTSPELAKDASKKLPPSALTK